MVVPTNVGFAADRGDLAVVESWLNNAGLGAVNDRCDSGYTCLHRSMASIGRERERVELVRFLISRGADVNVCAPHKWTGRHCTLHAAIHRTGSAEMVSLLLQAGAGVC